MKHSWLASVLAAGLMAEAAGPMVAAQNAYPAQQQQQYYKTENHRNRNKRIKHGVIGGAIGAGAGALLGGGAGAAIGAAAGGATGALWPVHHHHHYSNPNQNPNNR
jgi:hypothetical protein